MAVLSRICKLPTAREMGKTEFGGKYLFSLSITD
jgi:hypothetical protein